MINQVTLVGRLTRDPELRATPEGTSVTQVTLAVNRGFRNHNGEFDADFVQCTLWRKAAENTCHYCRKGSLVGITGRLQTRHYDNRDGKRVYVTEVVAESVRFLSSTRPQPSGGDSQSSSRERYNRAAETMADNAGRQGEGNLQRSVNQSQSASGSEFQGSVTGGAQQAPAMESRTTSGGPKLTSSFGASSATGGQTQKASPGPPPFTGEQSFNGADSQERSADWHINDAGQKKEERELAF
ncbi:single-stranded DNA-binding protein [Neobacillus mesonae]|uniref:single-stranded DNA-binding protein n=1 Tax=Neobacillus mesonae TaxID=1193713 RepID=UPI0020404197|nr:single-stranded DNA-binding protein [Neobacillus mesonae]MCM3567302.1 single-stranded DNA-binding protein [Neobacillus mesonae]